MSRDVPDRLGEIESRLKRVEANLDICLNYVKQIARSHLTAAQIAVIESQLNGGAADDDASEAPETPRVPDTR